MKNIKRIVSGTAIIASVLGIGFVFSDVQIAKADTVVNGVYTTMTTSDDGKTRSWDYMTFTNTVDKADLNGIIDNEIYYKSEKANKVRHMVGDKFLSHKDGGELYIPVPLSSAGSISFIDRNNKTDRYTELYINGVSSTRYVYCTKVDTPFNFTSSDITLLNDIPYLHFKNVVGEMKTTSITVNLTQQSYLGLGTPATGIVDNETNSPINVISGESHTLNYSITTESGDPTTDKSTWTSSNEKVATVQNGIVTATGAGDTTITLSVGEFTYSWNIHVDPVNATAITLDKTSHEGLVGDTFELITTLTPSNATDEVTWTSSNESVATVENGVVTYVGVGTSTITATINETIYATCEVEVSYISTTSVTLDYEELLVGVNGTQTLVATITPSDSQDEVIWSSDNEEVATVIDGVVTAVSEGEANITVTSGSHSATCKVTVSYKPADSVTLNVDYLTLRVNEAQQLIATILPSDANDVSTYSSSDASVAIVDNNGNVRGMKEGTATITVTAGLVTDTVEVTVEGDAGSLQFSTNVDGYPAASTNNFYVNGYSMVFNKTVAKEQTFEGTNFATGVQVKSITFVAESKGILKAYLCQTGNNKDRDLELQDINGNVVSSTHLPADQSAYVYQVEVIEPGFYKLYIKDNLSVDGTEGMINLYALSYNEIHVLSAHQVKTNSDSTKSIRLVGGVDETINLANVKVFGFEVNGTNYETNVALTSLNYKEGIILPSEFGVSYFFTYIFENTSSLSYRSYVTLKDGTTLYSSLNPVSIL